MASRVALGSLVVLAGSVLLGCASDGHLRSAFVPRQVDAEAVAKSRAQQRLLAERDALRRAEAEAVLAELGTIENQVRLRRAYDLDPAVLRHRHPSDLAALAPGALRVYDLSAVLADGPDDPVASPLQDERKRAWMDGEQRLLTRIIEQIRTDAGGRFDAPDTVIDVCGPCVFAVLPSAVEFSEFERLLDRHATTGGGFVRVELLLGDGAADVPQERGLTWRRADFDDIARRLAARGPVERLVVDVPFGRERGARRGGMISYVQDFDVDAASGMGDPLIGTLEDGIFVSARYAPDGENGASQVTLSVSVAETVRPVPEFTTQFQATGTSVRIQIPEMRAESFSASTAPDPARVMAARVLADRAIFVRTMTPTDTAGGAAAPAWARVPASASRARTYQHPLLTNALALAAAGADHADRDVFDAVRLAEAPIWAQTVRPSPERAEGVIYRWPIGDDVTRALETIGAADVASADAYGFVELRDGYVVACVDPTSAQALSRALLGLQASALQTPQFELTCPVPVSAVADAPARGTCADVSQLSFIQDFDVELASDAAIADPIIGVLQQGAVVAARAVPSAGPGVFDLRVEHAVLDGPIPTFSTGLGMGPDVTIQLPRLRQHATWIRVHIDVGQEIPLETEVVLRVDEETRRDVRRFVLRRLN